MKHSSYFSKSLFATSWGAIFIICAVFAVMKVSEKSLHTTTATSNSEIAAYTTNAVSASSVALRKDTPVSEILCLAKNIYYESGSESTVGKIAVGQVVLNRLAKAPNLTTVCGIVYEKSKDTAVCQFSWTCDSSKPDINTTSQAWKASYTIATNLLTSKTPVQDITDGATHFHAEYIKPSWAATMKKVVTIDKHLFYK